MDIKLHIILLNPPPGVDFGLQKGSGNNYETVEIQRSGSQDLNFHLTIALKGDKKKTRSRISPDPLYRALYRKDLSISISALWRAKHHPPGPGGSKYP
jgi:hypothetical protein